MPRKFDENISDTEKCILAKIVSETMYEDLRETVKPDKSRQDGGEALKHEGRMVLDISYKVEIDPDTLVKPQVPWMIACAHILSEYKRLLSRTKDTKAIHPTTLCEQAVHKAYHQRIGGLQRALEELQIAQAKADIEYARELSTPRRGSLRTIEAEVVKRPVPKEKQAH